MMLEGAGFRGRRPRARPLADRPPRAGAVLGPGAAGHRGARRLGGPRRPGRADVGLRGDELARRDLHRRSAGRAGVDRGDRSPRRTSAAPPWRWRAGSSTTRRETTRTRSTSCVVYLGYFPSSAWSYPPDVSACRRRSAPRPEILDLVPRNGRHVYDMQRRRRRRVRRRRPGSRCSPTSAGRSSLRPGAPGWSPGRRHRQPAAGAGRIDRRRRRRQGRALHHRGRLVPPAARLPRRQPGCHARAARRSSAAILRSGARMFAAQTVATSPKLARHAAQGLRLRLDGHGHDPLRRTVGRVRVPGRRPWARWVRRR